MQEGESWDWLSRSLYLLHWLSDLDPLPRPFQSHEPLELSGFSKSALSFSFPSSCYITFLQSSSSSSLSSSWLSELGRWANKRRRNSYASHLKNITAETDKNKYPQPVKPVSSLALSSSLRLQCSLYICLIWISYLFRVLFAQTHVFTFKRSQERGKKPSVARRDLERECFKEFLSFIAFLLNFLHSLHLDSILSVFFVSQRHRSFFSCTRPLAFHSYHAENHGAYRTFPLDYITTFLWSYEA